ncbi:transcription-repair coupling factor [Candidatus Curculioniphilus buchneri]|uniref:transcription-repair coupling factor n=1 Tax=Candidatus Curculioniphilus buchneri TaxID=690594 RepID=UPI00376F3D58
MLKQVYYTIPTMPGQKLILGKVLDVANSFECTMIIDHYVGPVMIITSNMKSALKLHHEIQKLTHYSILILPDWESCPYDHFSPNQKIISDRLFTLSRLPLMVRGAIIIPINTLMQRVCPKNFLHCHILQIVKGQDLSCNRLRVHLENLGYHKVDQVMVHGEFSIHNMLLDIYPMSSKKPFRIIFLKNKINELYMFDVDTQHTFQNVTDIEIFPTHEFPTNKSGMDTFRSQWRKYFDIRCDAKHIYQQVSTGVLPAGIEFWQPLFFNQPLVSLFSYLPVNTLLISQDDFKINANHFWKNIHIKYKNKDIDPMQPLLPPEILWLKVNNLLSEMKKWPQVQISSNILTQKRVDQKNMDFSPLPDLIIETQNKIPLNKLHHFCRNFDGQIIFLIDSENRWNIVSELLMQVNIQPKRIKNLKDASEHGMYYIIGANERGFIDVLRNRTLICESDWLGEHVRHQKKTNYRTINVNVLIRNLAELHKNQPVVHLEHGVGRYSGMTTLKVNGIESEYLIITYANDDKLYIPISSLHLISQYSAGSDEQAPLHKLGDEVWMRARKKTTERIRDTAVELLNIYTQRAIKTGFSFLPNKASYQIFCKEFPFETTQDQTQVINEVLSDMYQPLAMDRVICGGVGFGKTEVAMRAAFIAIENRKQVAVLVPNTLLAQQHFDNFRDRFANWPVHIEMISRFRNSSDQIKILNQTATGKVNILIGTHKLLQGNVQWYDLGLLIIDEEHRFGVRHKESLKAIRADVDILTLTATPIPRTLNMAMAGIRDLSIINTPPVCRLSVKTFIHEYDHLLIREVIIRELLRGGQVYYLHNEIESIKNTVYTLEKLVPEARIAVVHGKMHKHNLEQVMNDFHRRCFNILVCTTIIESGIDIANANTIIIERADHFGLAQLHQLRGRVGRSHHQAYAYLLTPPIQAMTHDAHKRLEAIASLKDLGAGLTLAKHDLEIRGAGELLGEDQSGQIETIGFSLYMELLESALADLKSGREPTFSTLTQQVTNLELCVPMLIPKEYISNINTRLSFYKRIASATNDHEIETIRIELIDRFGLLPIPTYHLLAIANLRRKAQGLGICRIEGNDKGGFIEFSEKNQRVDPKYLIDLLKTHCTTYQIGSPTRLKFICNLTDHTVRIEYIDQLLTKFQEHTLIA